VGNVFQAITVVLDSCLLFCQVGNVVQAIIYVVVFGVAAILGMVVVKFLDKLRRKDAETEARNLLEKATQEADTTKREAQLAIKEETLRQKGDAEREISKQRDEIRERERLLDKRQEAVEQQGEQVRKQERMVEGTQRRLAEKLEDADRQKVELQKLTDMQRQTLHELSGLTREDATHRLLEALDRELQQETGAIILNYQKKLEAECKAKGREMLLTAMQRFAAAHTAESTTSSVDIPSDEMKGRIIGREGRNIRSFEKETGVDVIIDDTPGVVIVSGFDPVRREIARQSLDKLIADGRIHPTRIEEVVAETKKEIEAFIRRKGEEAVQEGDIGGLHERLTYMLGRLHFRTSYSQNVLRHSMEVAYVSGMLAEMIGLDGRLARRAGLLHDIGKAADHEMEGGHPKIGADMLKRHGEPPEVVHAAFGHHD
jgi:ribonuclease Y